MMIYCTGCLKPVPARLTDGAEMYPHREDLAVFPFWVCDTCGAFVGTHYKTDNPTNPLGFLATKELKQWRMKIHAMLDPLWKDKKIKRGQAYAYVSNRLGHEFHTAEIKSVDEARLIYDIVLMLKNELDPGPFNR